MKIGLSTYQLFAVFIGILFCLTALASGIRVDTASLKKSNGTDYTGTLRVYVVEPVSRWLMASQGPYHYATLGLIETPIDIAPGNTSDQTMNWNGTDINESNIMVMAAIFNSEGHQAYSYPPDQNPFTAHYVDAAAAAWPGIPGYNKANETSTHTVFVEEGTATWCGYCPIMANALTNIYEYENYNFYFTALVEDKLPQAHNRLANDYDLYGYPTGYFDSGYEVLLGGDPNFGNYTDRINSSAQRPVPPLNLTVSFSIPSQDNLEIHIRIDNNEIPTAPNTPAAPTGPSTAYINTPCEFQGITTDHQNEPLQYLFDWGDGTDSGWVGPFPPGVPGSASHNWTTTGTYAVKVKAKDPLNHVSMWSPAATIQIIYGLFNITMKAHRSRVAVNITNTGTMTYDHLPWNIHVFGGLFGFTEDDVKGSITCLPVGASTTISSDRIFGFGSLTVTATIETTTMNTSGFVVGPFLFLRR